MASSSLRLAGGCELRWRSFGASGYPARNSVWRCLVNHNSDSEPILQPRTRLARCAGRAEADHALAFTLCLFDAGHGVCAARRYGFVPSGLRGGAGLYGGLLGAGGGCAKAERSAPVINGCPVRQFIARKAAKPLRVFRLVRIGSIFDGGRNYNGLRKYAKGLRLLLLMLFLLPASSLLAQTPEKTREFVYGVNAFTGLEYEGIAYPRTVNTIYLMADVVNIVSPRESMVYFWPITNELRVDWDELNETVHGTLEIVQRGQVVSTIEQTQYVVQYPDGLGTGRPFVYTDEEAERQFQEFQRLRIEFRDTVFAYYEATRNYRQELDEKAKAGTLEGEPPPPPEEPAPFIFYSTSVNDGYPITLAAGRYQIRVRDADGQIVPESTRNLIAFAPTREGVTYSIIPHDRYTFPEGSNDPSQVIYARAGTVFYLQPSAELEYNDFYLTRLSSPQSTEGNIDQWAWLPLREVKQGTLEVVENGQVVDRIERRNYVVRQITGNTLGYEIHDQETTDIERLRERRPDFAGYAIEVKSGQPSFRIRLVDENGEILPGSERDIHLVNTAAAGNLYALPLLPLGVGLCLVLWRRSRYTSHEQVEKS